MNIQRIVTLFEYNYWANGQILDLVELLTPEQLSDPARLSHNMAFDLVRHILDLEWSWRSFATGGVGQNYLWEVEDVADLTAILRFWKAESGRMFDYLNGLSEHELENNIDYGTAQGAEPQFMKVWQILLHVYTHGVPHRSELNWCLEQSGQRLPHELDLGTFLELQKSYS